MGALDLVTPKRDGTRLGVLRNGRHSSDLPATTGADSRCGLLRPCQWVRLDGMRIMFAVWTLLIVAGIVFFSIVGLTHA